MQTFMTESRKEFYAYLLRLQVERILQAYAAQRGIDPNRIRLVNAEGRQYVLRVSCQPR
jgi:hypothetical protein